MIRRAAVLAVVAAAFLGAVAAEDVAAPSAAHLVVHKVNSRLSALP